MFYKILKQTENGDCMEVAVMNIGKNISALRKEKGITQEELANELGVSAQAVSKWENNSSCPDVSLLTVIADYFGVSVDALLRAQGDEITCDEASESTRSASNSSVKKSINVKIIQKNGKETNVNVPYYFVKLGLNVGSMFGLDKEVAGKINDLINGENISDIADIVTENGEHVTVSLI